MALCYISHRKLTQVWWERWSQRDVGKMRVCPRGCVCGWRGLLPPAQKLWKTSLRRWPGEETYVVLGWRNVPERVKGLKTLRQVLAWHVRDEKASVWTGACPGDRDGTDSGAQITSFCQLCQTWLWVLDYLQWRHRAAGAFHRGRVSGCSRPGSHSLWLKPSWRRSPLTPG